MAGADGSGGHGPAADVDRSSQPGPQRPGEVLSIWDGYLALREGGNGESSGICT